MIGYKKPKFSLGDAVTDRDPPRRTGIVSHIGSYDDYLGGYRYKVLEESGRRNFWNETSMVKLTKKGRR